VSDTCTVRIILEEGASTPIYKTQGSAGADIIAKLDAPIKLEPMERVSVPTGLHVELPEGYEAQIRPRSGLAINKGITCLNSPGTVDSDYRGEIRVLLINLGTEAVWINNGERIAQMVITSVSRAVFTRAEMLSRSSRGSDGFGSTGL
jgi:dUTP pyrophosphatase